MASTVCAHDRATSSVFNARLKFIEPVQFMYSLYLYGSMPLISQAVRFLIQTRYDAHDNDIGIRTSSCSGGGTTGNNTQKADVEVEAARWLMYLNLAVVGPAFFSTIFFGGLSNRVGRKTILLFPLIGAMLRMLTFIVVFALRLHIAFLLLSAILDGFLGMSCTMLMACFSYMADVTSSQRRSIRIVLLEVCSGAAIIVSNLATGYLIQAIGYTWVFVVLVALLCLNFCYVVCFLAESLDLSAASSSSSTAGSSSTTAVGSSLELFTRAFRLFVRDDGDGRGWRLRAALLINFLVTFVQLGRSEVQILFLLTFPLCFTSVWIGYVSAVFYFVTNLTSVVATRTLIAYVGDVGLILLGSIFGVSYELVFGFSVSTVMVFLASLAGCAQFLPIALLRAYISKIVEPSEVASAFAVFAWIQMISSIVGGVTQNAIFSATANWMINFVFVVDAIIYAVTAVVITIFLVYLRKHRQRFEYQQISNEEARVL